MKLECLTCIIARFTGCSEWDPYEKNSPERPDKEFPGVFSPQAATAQEVKVDDWKIGETALQWEPPSYFMILIILNLFAIVYAK